ncbi:MAG: dihydropteroate synthase, partial [Kiritimatiellae bacterium]|nr:dihydropteroate synthase [Kiritimatiellia bacterium]
MSTTTKQRKPDLCEWLCRERVIPLGHRAWIMGILNVTPDSFSDGGTWLDPDQAVAHALEMVAEGA